MRTIRVYQPGTYQTGDVITLSTSATQHVGLVLRMTAGETLTLFRGDNYEFKATLVAVQKKHIQACIESMTLVDRESPRKIHLVQALVKGDKMEWIIQKAVELGVSSITPLITEHSVVRLNTERLQKKQYQWEAIAIAACEQSGRNHLPVIHPTCSLEQYVTTSSTTQKWILSPKATQSWPEINADANELALLIGPEGGFSDAEIKCAHEHYTQSIRLGPRILRTETAAITGIGIMQMKYGDLSVA
ncbi:MAG: 16S rRNA (uracil(1498)-N(3))-methyltransferase [Gammaproteobacteria bacterium]|nr:16S rRNA (uracil(1498)-N(3))-methyltransferase [Gammaproteobacteria bacterium]